MKIMFIVIEAFFLVLALIYAYQSLRLSVIIFGSLREAVKRWNNQNWCEPCDRTAIGLASLASMICTSIAVTFTTISTTVFVASFHLPLYVIMLIVCYLVTIVNFLSVHRESKNDYRFKTHLSDFISGVTWRYYNIAYKGY
jgi:hypothetical protein